MNDNPSSPYAAAPNVRANKSPRRHGGAFDIACLIENENFNSNDFKNKSNAAARANGVTIRARLRASVVFFLVLLPGCFKDFGVGGMGEMVVPPERLHDVQNFNPQNFSSGQAPPTQPSTRPESQPSPPEIMLTLQECRALALRNDLDLKVELYSPSISETAVTEAQAAFEPTIGGNLNFNRNKLPPNGGTPFRTDLLTASANLQLPLETGGSLSVSAPLQRLDNTFPGAIPNYVVGPNVTFSQPLLRGFGPYVAAQGIRIAFYQYEQSQAVAKLAVIRVLAEADRAYWALYSARQQLDVRQTQYDSAAAQLERARREARAGVIAEVDIVRAESGVADQVEQILLAQNTVRSTERDLKRILNRPDLDVTGPTRLLLATPPNNTPYMLDRNRLTRAALLQRMELLQTELQIAAETASVRVARNDMLPLLAFQYTFGLNGSARTFGGAYDQVWTKDFESHTFGLQLQIPVGNEAARSRLRRALLSRLQQLATRDQQVLQIRQDVLNAADNLETDWQRILASRKRVELAARTLDVETHQFELGLRTSTDVLIAQANLGDARSSAITSVSDYQIAQVDLAFATGTTLTASGVVWKPQTESNARHE